MSDAAPTKDTKNAKIMLGVFGLLTLIFACGGAAITGVAGYGSESDGMTAAMISIGPACCSMAGLLIALVSLVAFPSNSKAQIAAPIVAGIIGGFVGAVGLIVFFQIIWPSL